MYIFRRLNGICYDLRSSLCQCLLLEKYRPRYDIGYYRVRKRSRIPLAYPPVRRCATRSGNELSW